jgi:hypothetical protein
MGLFLYLRILFSIAHIKGQRLINFLSIYSAPNFCVYARNINFELKLYTVRLQCERQFLFTYYDSAYIYLFM